MKILRESYRSAVVERVAVENLVVVAILRVAYHGIVEVQVDHFARVASCAAAAVMGADLHPSASAASGVAECQRIAVAAVAFVMAAEGLAEVVVPLTASAVAYDPVDQLSVELVRRRTIDADDQHATTDSERPINVRRPNRDVHLWNLF